MSPSPASPWAVTIRLDRLRVDRIEAMFTAIAGRTTATPSGTRHSDSLDVPAAVTGARATGPATHAPYPGHPA